MNSPKATLHVVENVVLGVGRYIRDELAAQSRLCRRLMHAFYEAGRIDERESRNRRRDGAGRFTRELKR